MRIVLLVLLVMVLALPAYAEDTTDATYFNEYVNDIDLLNHTHALDKEAKFQQGVGLDLVAYENKTVSLGTEVRYNFTTNVTTAFSVFKLKKPLLSYFFKK